MKKARAWMWIAVLRCGLLAASQAPADPPDEAAPAAAVTAAWGVAAAAVSGAEERPAEHGMEALERDAATPEGATVDEADGFFSIAQRRALADWFGDREQPWPGGGDWPALEDGEAVRQAVDALWSIYREAERSGPSHRELGPLPDVLDTSASPSGGRPLQMPGGMLTLGEYRMPFLLVRKETAPPPAGGRALYLCMHGGGANPNADGPHAWPVNTREWQTQATLAARRHAGEGLYFVPRMPDDRRGRWWHAHIQEAFDRVIEHGLREWQVDPDRVFILGISEGAFGTLILAPHMADRFAGANAMAGGETDQVPAENLRNVALRTDVGENDTMFNRVGLAREYHARLEAARGDYGGYVHYLNVQPGRGHAIDYTPGVEWMIRHRRDARPDTVVWTARPLDGRRRSAFYWLGLQPARPDQRVRLVGRLLPEQNAVEIDAAPELPEDSLEGARVRVLLDDALLDLDREITVNLDGRRVFHGRAQRCLETLARTLAERGDPRLAFPVEIEL